MSISSSITDTANTLANTEVQAGVGANTNRGELILSSGAVILLVIPLNPCVFELGRGGTSKLAKV